MVNFGVRRLNVGGKILTNHLKQVVSYRAYNVMDETHLINDIKERLCYVSLDFGADLALTRFKGKKDTLRRRMFRGSRVAAWMQRVAASSSSTLRRGVTNRACVGSAARAASHRFLAKARPRAKGDPPGPRGGPSPLGCRRGRGAADAVACAPVLCPPCPMSTGHRARCPLPTVPDVHCLPPPRQDVRREVGGPGRCERPAERHQEGADRALQPHRMQPHAVPSHAAPCCPMQPHRMQPHRMQPHRMQPHVEEAAGLCSRGCSPMQPRLQPVRPVCSPGLYTLCTALPGENCTRGSLGNGASGAARCRVARSGASILTNPIALSLCLSG